MNEEIGVMKVRIHVVYPGDEQRGRYRGVQVHAKLGTRQECIEHLKQFRKLNPGLAIISAKWEVSDDLMTESN